MHEAVGSYSGLYANALAMQAEVVCCIILSHSGYKSMPSWHQVTFYHIASVSDSGLE